jgi:hypothetical protein
VVMTGGSDLNHRLRVLAHQPGLPLHATAGDRQLTKARPPAQYRRTAKTVGSLRGTVERTGARAGPGTHTAAAPVRTIRAHSRTDMHDIAVSSIGLDNAVAGSLARAEAALADHV